MMQGFWKRFGTTGALLLRMLSIRVTQHAIRGWPIRQPM